MATHHLAELNVGRLKHPVGDPRIADFVNNLDRVNAAAERSPGFVWRLKDDVGSSVSMHHPSDPLLIPNMSVWEDVNSLENYVFRTVHKRIYERRHEWFEVVEKMNFVMWFVPVGHQPMLTEAYARLDHLNEHGASDHAFGWDHVKSASLWRTARCEASVA